MTHRWVRAALLLGAAVVGCAYYNGLYNANRLAGDAKRAEREGRAAEARSLWAQAAVKAESVATRYPTSRHWDDALLLWGEGLTRAGNCRQAESPLAVASDSAADPAVQLRARLLLAECNLNLDDPRGAIAAVEPLLDSPDTTLVHQARLIRGRAFLRLDNPTAAAADLRAVPASTGAFDLARAQVALGEFETAHATLEARVPGRYVEPEWLSVLTVLGGRRPERASAIVDLLADRADLTPGQRARLLLADGERWLAAHDQPRADDRFAAVTSVAADSIEAGAARAHLAVAELRFLDDLERLPTVEERLRDAARGSGRAPVIARKALDGTTIALETLGDSVRASRDLRLFLLAELFRDSLEAPVPATQIFLRLAHDHPTSMIAPKALLAAAYLDADRAPAIRAELDGQYPDSPYTLFLRGQAGSAFQVVEDSLRTALATIVLGGDPGQREREAGDQERRQGREREQ